MKKIALLLALNCAARLFGQAIAVNEFSFDATSDKIAAGWYQPLVPGVTIVFEGFGANEGLTKSETCSLGDTVAGVKTVKRHIEGSSAAVPAEDWWIARDSNDDLRVLKLVRAGLVIFEASAPTNAPLFMPGTMVEGTTWELFGETFTVEWLTPSHSGGLIKVRRNAGASVSYQNYRSANGITYEVGGSEAEPASGWRPKTEVSNSPATP